MDDELREKVIEATSEACRQFMARLGLKYPWLHPDFDPDSSFWRLLANEARERDRRRFRRFRR